MSEEVKEENVVTEEKSHKALIAVLFIVFTIVVLGVLSLILIPKLLKKPVKTKDNLTFEINSEVKYSELVEISNNAKLEKGDDLVDTSKLGEKSVDVVYLKGNNKEIVTVKIKIIDTTKPEIKCEEKVEIYEGMEFNPNSQCEITDNSKEELVPEIGDYDNKKAGEYKVSVKVKDSSGNEAESNITLVVKKVELHNDGYYVYKTSEQWDEFVFRADGTGSYVPWYCPGSGCGGYGEDGKYTIEGNVIVLVTTTASNEGEVSKVNNRYEFKYVNKEELKWENKGKEYTLKWQKEYNS